jgi:hypothetical protein
MIQYCQMRLWQGHTKRPFDEHQFDMQVSAERLTAERNDESDKQRATGTAEFCRQEKQLVMFEVCMIHAMIRDVHLLELCSFGKELLTSMLDSESKRWTFW